jgi:hypothetical protein
MLARAMSDPPSGSASSQEIASSAIRMRFLERVAEEVPRRDEVRGRRHGFVKPPSARY